MTGFLGIGSVGRIGFVLLFGLGSLTQAQVKSAKEPTYKGQPVGYWSKMLEDRDPATRKIAVDALGGIGAEGAGVSVAALLSALERENDPEVCKAALEALGRMDQRTLESKLTEVIHLMKRFDEAMSLSEEMAAKVLKGTATASEFEDGTRSIELSMAYFVGVPAVLGKIGADAIPQIIGALENGSANVRSQALKALGHMGPEAAPALPKVEEAAQNDPVEIVRKNATEALQRIRP